jgi:hypothetical protein
MSKRQKAITWKAAAGVAIVVVPVLTWALGPGGTFDLSWYTIDGGGVMRSTGGGFELSGTIGQHDAGPGAPGMTGGGFELTGGFWLALAPGDCNSDGGVNLFDYRDFQPCLGGPGTAVGGSCLCHDLDRSSTVDLADFADLQTGFHGQ